jgi:phosphoglycerate dehydrogenase-like enzyme/predicted dehydrogenase
MSVDTSTTRPLRILVIGAGPAAQAMHLPVLARLRDQKRLELAIICDLDAQRATAAKQRYGFLEISADASAATRRQDLDAVYIFGSAQLHHRCGLMALRSGKHLFVEKPIAPSYAEAATLVEAARSSGTVAVGAHNRRFYEALTAVRMHAGKTGWRFAEAVFHKAEFGRPPLYGANTWLGANGIHALDALLFMMGGPPAELRAMAGATGKAPVSAFSALMRWRDGAQGVFLCNNDSGARREEYIFHGLGESFRVSDGGVTRESEAGTTTTRHAWIGDGIEAEHRAFLDAAQDHVEPLHSLSAIAPSLFVGELIEAGFSGAVQLPAAPSASHPPPAAAPAAKGAVRQGATIAVTPLPVLLSAVARLAPGMRTTSLEEIRSSDAPRPDVVAVILGGAAALGEEDLDKLPNLAVVGVHRLSLKRYQPQLLLARGIALVNADAAYAESVAEFALGLMILGRRRAFASHEALRAGEWGVRSPMTGLKGTLRRRLSALRPALRAAGLEAAAARLWRRALPAAQLIAARTMIPRDLRGASIGLIGWGSNARALTRRLLEAGADVAVYSQHAAPQDICVAGARAVPLSEALAADVVSLHRGLTQGTQHFLGQAELEKLRPGALLINVARGALIEPDALLSRLRRGDIFACLDTYDEEPLKADHPLRALPNVFLTAHIAGAAEDIQAAAAHEVVSKVSSCLQGDVTASISARRLSTMT